MNFIFFMSMLVVALPALCSDKVTVSSDEVPAKKVAKLATVVTEEATDKKPDEGKKEDKEAKQTPKPQAIDYEEFPPIGALDVDGMEQ